MLVDIGVNLTSNRFDKDRQQVIDAALESGVSKMIVTGTDFETNQQAFDLASSHGSLYATAGCHPHHASEWSEAYIAQITELAQQDKVKAIGECGLDFNRNFSPPDAQRKAFVEQLELAVAIDKPVFLHQRDAHQDFIDILKPFLPKLKGACLHCFTGSEQELVECVEHGLYIGVTGWICDERRGQELKRIVKLIPQGRLMVETDAPYLLPRDMRPKPKSSRNLPQYLPHIVAEVARCRDESIQELMQHTTETAREFFDL